MLQGAKRRCFTPPTARQISAMFDGDFKVMGIAIGLDIEHHRVTARLIQVIDGIQHGM